MNRIAIVAVLFLLSACSASQYHQNQETFRVEVDATDLVPITRPDTKIPFYGLLPYENQPEQADKSPNELNGLLNITPIFPEGEELQNCIGSIFVIVNPRAKRGISMIPFAICFRNRTSTRIPSQMRDELRMFARILNRQQENHLMLLIPDGVINRAVARQRITVVKEFLIEAGVPESKIIELQDSPPE